MLLTVQLAHSFTSAILYYHRIGAIDIFEANSYIVRGLDGKRLYEVDESIWYDCEKINFVEEPSSKDDMLWESYETLKIECNVEADFAYDRDYVRLKTLYINKDLTEDLLSGLFYVTDNVYHVRYSINNPIDILAFFKHESRKTFCRSTRPIYCYTELSTVKSVFEIFKMKNIEMAGILQELIMLGTLRKSINK